MCNYKNSTLFHFYNLHFRTKNKIKNVTKFYGKVGVISWFLFHLIWKNYILYWDFDLKSWIVDFLTRFTQEKIPQNNFSSQNFSVENNYSFGFSGNYQCGPYITPIRDDFTNGQYCLPPNAEDLCWGRSEYFLNE